VRQRFADLFFDQLGRGANLTLLCGVTSCVAAETPESTVHARKTAMNVSAKLRFVMSAKPCVHPFAGQASLGQDHRYASPVAGARVGAGFQVDEHLRAGEEQKGRDRDGPWCVVRKLSVLLAIEGITLLTAGFPDFLLGLEAVYPTSCGY